MTYKIVGIFSKGIEQRTTAYISTQKNGSCPMEVVVVDTCRGCVDDTAKQCVFLFIIVLTMLTPLK